MELGFGARHQLADHVKHTGIAVRCGHPAAQTQTALAIKRRDLDLRAAQINAYPHGCRVAKPPLAGKAAAVLHGGMEQILDVRGLLCPLPVLKANKALRALPGGAELTVLATDPAAKRDFPAFARETGHILLSFVQEDAVLRFVLRKRADV